MKHLFIIATLTISTLWAQIPNGYYNPATGLDGPPLQAALHDIIDDHTAQSYSSLWTHYQTTDVKPNGKVWDMYSDIPDGTPPYEFTFVSDQCGNYGAEGDCYNREHSWPKSWFNDVLPMNTDLFHVVPSDGYVNGQRGNYPYGEVSIPSWTSQNGTKKGPNTYPGYSGTVFEPIDAYKGDFARIYFYMSTRYLGEDSTWPGSPMVNGAQLEEWALDMMMDWHAQDPVSQKEIDRNNTVYVIQNNRNPFVDHPSYADLIWGEVLPLPDIPSDLVSSNISDTALDLSWTDNSDAESGFYVYQDGSRLATLAQNIETYSVIGLSASTTYNFSVSSFNDNGESAQTSHTVSTTGGGGSAVTHFFEDFETASGVSFIEGDITLPSGTWSAYQAGAFGLGEPYSGSKSLAINDDISGAHIITPAVNGLGTLSFYYYQRNGAAGDEFQIQRSVAGSAFETITTQSYNVGTSYTLFSLNLADSSESIRIKILNDDQAGHLIIDDLMVTAYEPVGVDAEFAIIQPAFALYHSYPNPFNPSIQLGFSVIGSHPDLSLEIYDIQGQLIRTLFNGALSTGQHMQVWDGQNESAVNQPSGLYIVQLRSGNHSDFQRITLLR